MRFIGAGPSLRAQPVRRLGLEPWLLAEQRYRRLYGLSGPPAGSEGPEVVLRTGHRYVLCAPHAVAQRRGGMMKRPELWVGSLTEALAELTGSSAVVPLRTLIESPWNERTDEVADAVRHAAVQNAMVIDLHGMTDAHGIDICLGLGPNPPDPVLRFAATIQDAFARPLRVSVNRPFAASAPHTVTSYVQDLGGKGIQVEIAARLRRPRTQPTLAAMLFNSLIQVLAA